ncbi:MAG: hypothetical protein Q7R96_02855 [Nanoarchaeota archaeon]|nr:hypothetical protein [Nanoarchaeota archaeon]
MPDFIKYTKIFDKHLPVPDRIQIGLTYLLRLTIIIAAAEAISTQRWLILLFSIGIFFLTFVTSFIQNRYKLYIPIEFEFITILFIYGTLFLGELESYYIKYWWWDTMLHTGSGILFGFLGFIILYTLYKRDKLQARPFWIALFTFSFALALGGLWEIFEFGMDQFFPYTMQENGLVDTMWDLIVDTIGALLISVLGYFYIKGGEIPFVSRIMRRFKRKNPHLFKERRFKLFKRNQ